MPEQALTTEGTVRDLLRRLPVAQERIAADPHVVAPTWTVYGLRADEVEFWQADRDRRHVRLRYRRGNREWLRERLWP